jgi:hypothetical protein
MFGLFKRDPAKKMVKAIEVKREEALRAQRSGDMRAYASLSAEVEAMEDQVIAMRASE